MSGLSSSFPLTPDLRPQEYRTSTTTLVLATVMINILSLALPVMTLQVYDRILPHPDSGTLPILASGVVVAIILEMFIRLARSYVVNWQGAVYEFAMTGQALGKVLGADPGDMKTRGPGEHLHRLSAIARLREEHNGSRSVTVTDLAFIPLFIAFVIYIAGPLAVVPVTGLMIFCLMSLWYGQRLRYYLKARDKADDDRYNFLIETLEGFHTLKAMTLEKIFQRKYENLEEKSAANNFDTAQITAQSFNACATLSSVMVATIITLGALLVLHHEVTAGALVATLLLSGRMMQMMQRGLLLWIKRQDTLLARDKLCELFDTPDVRGYGDNSHLPKNPVGGELSVNRLQHSAASTGSGRLDISDFHVSPGETVLLSGAAATGKSTLLMLLAGIIHDPASDIRIDGRALSSYEPADLTRHIAYIGPDPVIFRGSIRHNITRFGHTDILQARRAAAQLGIDKEIARLPMGFDTFLMGTSSDVLPPGLRQRIAIARILALRPGILLLDEAEAMLDRHGQRLLLRALAEIKNHISIIIVSDEPSLRSLATRHVVLQNGSLISAPLPSKEVF